MAGLLGVFGEARVAVFNAVSLRVAPHLGSAGVDFRRHDVLPNCG